MDLQGNVGEPIHLTATAALQPKAQGIGPNSIALKNPMDLPMEIHEIKWQLQSTPSNIALNIVSCELYLGKIAITNGYIPVCNFGRGSFYSREALNGVINGATNYYLETRWRLPRPLYVPAGAVLQPRFTHNGLITQSINARISYGGRTLPKSYKPARNYAPYVTCFKVNPMDPGVAATDSSTETDIANPFKTPLILQRLVGRFFFFGNASAVMVEQVGGQASVAERLYQIRIMDSKGRPIIRDYAGFTTVFNPQTRSFECDGAIMEPGDYYNIQVNKLAPLVNGGATVNNIFGYISAVGYREVA